MIPLLSCMFYFVAFFFYPTLCQYLLYVIRFYLSSDRHGICFVLSLLTPFRWNEQYLTWDNSQKPGTVQFIQYGISNMLNRETIDWNNIFFFVAHTELHTDNIHNYINWSFDVIYNQYTRAYCTQFYLYQIHTRASPYNFS